jgi:PEGA domain-containing protein
MRALALWLLIAPAIAHADGAGVIASDGALAKALGDALAGRAPRIVPDAVGEARSALAAGAVPVETLAQFRRVREEIDDGWRAYLQVSIDTAAVKLAHARTEAEVLLALPGGAELYADAALRLGAVLGHQGRTPESRAVYALALALDPERPITLAEFSPDVVDAVEAVRKEPASLQKVHVTSSPPNAELVIDGHEAGRAPADVALARGQHVVVARLAGAEPAVRGFAVDDAVEVALTLAPDPAAARLGPAARGLPDTLAQGLVDTVIRYADLDEVVLAVATARRGGPTLLVQRCAGLPARCSAVVEVGYGAPSGLAAAARSAWEAARAGELRYPPTVLGELGDRVVVDNRCKLCRNPWVWTGVGAAVLTGAVIALIATSGSKPAPVVGFDPSQF